MQTRDPRSLIALIRGGPVLVPVGERTMPERAHAPEPTPPRESMRAADLPVTPVTTPSWSR
jgi:hypothetical protein